MRKRVIVFLSVFGAIWLLAEPLGMKPGLLFFVQMAIWALLLSEIYIMIREARSNRTTLIKRENELENLKKTIASIDKHSYCCVLPHNRPVCPLGVSAIHDHVDMTLKSSLSNAKRSFKWLGLSAFNVVHNNYNIFKENLHVDYEFVTVSPDESKLLQKIDEYYMTSDGALSATDLVNEGNKIFQSIQENIHSRLSVKHHSQMPTFRIILLDNDSALVSFYERGEDALKSHQIEISDSDEAPYNILKWFQMFYEKTLINEQVKRTDGNT